MPKGRTGYAALPAHDELDEEEEDQQENESPNRVADGGPSSSFSHLSQSTSALPNAFSVPLGAGAGPGVRKIPRRTNSGSTAASRRLHIDIRALDAKLQQWVHTVGRRFAKGKNKALRDFTKPYEIVASAFGPVEPHPDKTREMKTLDHEEPMTQRQFDDLIDQIRVAIRLGLNPKLNRAGTSGSYFAKTPEGKTRGIFKPKNEEPYGSLNPKWSKWFHRHIFGPFIGFGRACLIPNFSYLSEAGASLLSDRLSVYIVPPTQLVSLSSPSFFYDWIDRRAYSQQRRPLPEKIGSFQVFLDGYQDASEFLKANPWPGRTPRDALDFERDQERGTRDRSRRRRRRNWTRSCRLLCGTAGVDDDSDSEDEEEVGPRQSGSTDSSETLAQPFVWTKELMSDFRLELEKLVILDVLMRNTDRGLDNFMIKICQGPCRTPSSASLKDKDDLFRAQRTQPGPRETLSIDQHIEEHDTRPYRSRSHVHVAAIDNSLSFPIHHPNSWRVYPYGWLFLPSSLVGQPFSREAREHFLPLLTNPVWLAETVFELRKLFSQDDDFNERMFQKQIALFKGQAWNVVMSLRNPEEGPLELCRRTTCLVHDDEEEMADDDFTKEMIEAASRPEETSDANGSLDGRASPFRPGMARNQTTGAGAAAFTKPKVNRHSSDRPLSHRPLSAVQAVPRPLPTFKHVDLTRPTFGNASGVRLMEHMEKVQRREEDVAHSLGVSLPSDADLQDDVRHAHARAVTEIGTGSTIVNGGRGSRHRAGVSLDLDRESSRSISPAQRLGRSRSGSVDETGAREARRTSLQNATLTASAVDAERMPVGRKVVIVERVEQVDARPYFVRC